MLMEMTPIMPILTIYTTLACIKYTLYALHINHKNGGILRFLWLTPSESLPLINVYEQRINF